MGQKLSSKLLFMYSPNSDGFYIFYISQGSVATLLRCGGMFSNHFIPNFPQKAPMKKIDNRSLFDTDMVKTLWLTFSGPPCISRGILYIWTETENLKYIHYTVIGTDLTTGCTDLLVLSASSIALSPRRAYP